MENSICTALGVNGRGFSQPERKILLSYPSPPPRGLRGSKPWEACGPCRDGIPVGSAKVLSVSRVQELGERAFFLFEFPQPASVLKALNKRLRSLHICII